MIKAKMMEPIITKVVLFCSSGQVGQLTLLVNSLYDSLIYSTSLVLETSALPTELHPFKKK